MLNQASITDEMLTFVAEDLRSQRLPLERVSLRDDQIPGLRAVVNKSGSIQYLFTKNSGERVIVPAASLAEARKLALAA